MTDYLQPEFYRFNEDSLLLVKEIVSSGIKPKNILDIGAGSGVIGIELALELKTQEIHFLELQREWEPYLSENIKQFLKDYKVEVLWSSVGNWTPELKYDLIVSNPPYYLPEKGRLSIDPVRAHCRSFLEDDWELLLAKSYSALAPGGNAFFVTALQNLDHVKRAGKMLRLETIQKEKILIIKLSSE